MNEHYVINLGRQLGSGGKEIGEKLAQEFGIAFYDKELIKLAAYARNSLKKQMKKLLKALSAVCSEHVFLLSATEPFPMAVV
mgnify:CR=1 FL=1